MRSPLLLVLGACLSGCFSETWIDVFAVDGEGHAAEVGEGEVARYAFRLVRTEIEGETRIPADKLTTDASVVELTKTAGLFCPPYGGKCLSVWELRGIRAGEAALNGSSALGLGSLEASTVVRVRPRQR